MRQTLRPPQAVQSAFEKTSMKKDTPTFVCESRPVFLTNDNSSPERIICFVQKRTVSIAVKASWDYTSLVNADPRDTAAKAFYFQPTH